MNSFWTYGFEMFIRNVIFMSRKAHGYRLILGKSELGYVYF